MRNAHDHPLSSYLARLKPRGALDDADCAAFATLRSRVELHDAGDELVSPGDALDECIFLIDGFVSRSKVMKAGRRQILAFYIPGDAVGLQTLFLDKVELALETHISTTIVSVPQDDITELMRARPNMMRALWRESSIETAIFHEWAVSLGGRSARQRIAHLLLELEARFKVRLPSSKSFCIPVKQAGLAGALGLSLVHLNKSLQWLRRQGFISVNGRIFEISKRDELTAFCGFDPKYLRLQPALVRERHQATSRLRSVLN